MFKGFDSKSIQVSTCARDYSHLLSSNTYSQNKKTKDFNLNVNDECNSIGKIDQPMPHSIQKPKALYSCFHCEYKGNRKSRLTQHIRSKHQHSQVHPYTCKTCNRGYKLKSSLVRHMKKVHSNAVSFPCGRSIHVTKKKQHSGKHSKKKHELSKDIPKSYTCDICSKTYTVRESILRHLKVAHSDAPIFHCHVCNYTTKREQDFKTHIKLKHSALCDSGNIKVKNTCRYCKQIYRNKKDLAKHRNKCDMRPSFVCNYCSYASIRRNDVKRHTETMHSNEVNS